MFCSLSKKTKGQLTSEFLFILAVMLLLLSIVVVITQEQRRNIEQIKFQNDAANTVAQIGSAANDVYSQGEGARRRVFVQIPLGYDFEKSYVRNRTINVNVAGSDHAFVMDYDVRGSLPLNDGNHWIWVVSEGNRVKIGSIMFVVDRQSIFTIMDKNTEKDEQMIIQNVFGSHINGSLQLLWNNPAVTAELDKKIGRAHV